MKKYRILSLILALAMLLSACSGSTVPESSTQVASETAESEKAAETTPAETASTTEAAPTETSSSARQETANTAGETDSEEQAVEIEEDFFPLGLNDVAELPDLDDHGLEAEPEEIDRIQRSMRAYQPPENSPLINNAPYFYYYEQLTQSQKILYDILRMAAEDPSGNNFVAYLTMDHPTSNKFKQDVNVVFYSMLYDHPEFFWLYESQRIYWRYSKEKDYSYYVVYFYVEEYPTFREDVETFNEAVDSFLGGIDTSGSQLDVARRIHDKLINLVDYDYDLADRNTRSDLGHTAYGALVANSAGEANHAVCDGYSLAFNYLLQQVGIPTALMIGYAGAKPENAGCHAWSIINCDGKWVEADSTWDDFGNTLIRMERDNSKWLEYWKEIYKHKSSRELKEHSFFAISTEKMRYYKAPEKKYTTNDGKWVFTLLSDSVHIRDNELHSGTTRSTIFAMAPIAP